MSYDFLQAVTNGSGGKTNKTNINSKSKRKRQTFLKIF